MSRFLFSVAALALAFVSVNGHGMLMDPINRASRWREDPSAPANWDDNGLYCGGLTVQWQQNGGRCGLCGDNYADIRPRRHELGGQYGQGVIVKRYAKESTVTVQALLTQNHRGYFEFRVCNLDRWGAESDECFNDILVQQPNGETKYYVNESSGYHSVTLKLPAELQCNHCVMQWTYTAGNTWGPCGDGSHATGCGPQETFRTCSDINIFA